MPFDFFDDLATLAASPLGGLFAVITILFVIFMMVVVSYGVRGLTRQSETVSRLSASASKALSLQIARLEGQNSLLSDRVWQMTEQNAVMKGEIVGLKAQLEDAVRDTRAAALQRDEWRVLAETERVTTDALKKEVKELRAQLFIMARQIDNLKGLLTRVVSENNIRLTPDDAALIAAKE